MPENKKHHYVPKFYLKRFSKDKRSICLYNLPRELKVTKANLKNQCYKDYFYGKDKTTEHALAGMEGETSLLYREIDRYGSLPPPITQEHIAFIISVLIQYGRTKYSADAMDEMHDKMFKQTFKEKIESELEDVNLDDFIVGIQDVASYSIGLLVQYYPLLLDLEYKLLINKTKTEFITSDNPVVMINQLLSFRKIGSNTGLSVKGLQIFYPLSPDKLAIIYDENVYRVGSDNKVVIDVTNEKDVYNLNSLQGCSCYENIYFMNENQDVSSLHKKVKPYLRKNKANIKVFPEYDDGKKKSELIMNYKEDIKFNMNLSFLTLRKSAKKWRGSFKKLRRQPAEIMRDKSFHDDVEEFVEKVKNGELQTENFITFMEQKYDQS